MKLNRQLQYNKTTTTPAAPDAADYFFSFQPYLLHYDSPSPSSLVIPLTQLALEIYNYKKKLKWGQ